MENENAICDLETNEKGKGEEMKWFKVDFNDVFLNGLTTAEVGCVIKYKCMCQQLGVDSLDEVRIKSIFTSREQKFVRDYFKVCSKNTEVCSGLSEVCSENAKVCSKNDSKNNNIGSPIYKTDKTEKRDITPLSMSPQRVDDTQLDLEEAIAKTKRFVKPTVEEINSYCREKNKSVDAERFWNFYESKGWKVGKNPMKDWRAAVCNWAKDATPVVQESYRSSVDTEKLNHMASIAELTKQRMAEQVKLKYGA